jgi:uncharacterized iron-regulated membrane protein
MIRKVLFQVHLWSGIGVGLYVVVISLTGSLLVFRVEYYKYFRPGTTVEVRSTERFSDDALKAAVEHRYPALKVTSLTLRRRQRNAPADVYLEGNGTKLHRLFDPYTGEDLGDAEPRATRVFEKVAQLHDNLLGDRKGRTINGIGGVFLAVMSLTGMVIWWPGARNVKRGLMLKWNTSWKRFNWDLHSVFGFWTFAFVFMWAITSVYMVFPDPFLAVVDYLEPPRDDVLVRSGDTVLEWFAKLHIGRFSGLWVKIVWGVIGLVPPVLFVTGVIMWWNRKVRGWRRSEEGLFEQVRLRAYSTYVKAFFRQRTTQKPLNTQR